MNAADTALRLQEAAAKCLSSLDAWNKNLNDRESRESLQDAVHELRKVTSRLEIDIAMNDRKVTNAKTIPIPEHKSKVERKSHKPLSEILPIADIKDSKERKKIAIEEANDDADTDNHAPQDNEQSNDSERKQRRPRRKKREDNAGGEE